MQQDTQTPPLNKLRWASHSTQLNANEATLTHIKGSHSPFSDLEVDDEENDAQENTHGPDDEVGDAEERVLAAEPRRRRQDEALGPVKHRHRVV